MTATPSLQEVCLQAKDGFSLAGTLYHPEQRPVGAVIVSSATGVRQRYYRHLATYLAQQGYLTLTYDYRGIGESRPSRLRGFPASLSTWATLDKSAAIQYMLGQGLPLFWVGHSSGGQTVGLADGAEQLRAVVSVASGAGYCWKMTGVSGLMTAALLYGYVPVTTAIFGYAPARAIGQGQDLPAGVAQELARWCRSPRYFADHISPDQRQKLEALQLPWLALSFSDDILIDQEAVERLLSLYPGAQIERRRITPPDIGQVQIGHHGYFLPLRSGLLWPQLIDYFQGFIP